MTSKRKQVFISLLAAVASSFLIGRAFSAERVLVVPTRTIYPKELFKEDDFTFRSFYYEPMGVPKYVESLPSISGYNSRTTLPAFKPVPLAAIERTRRINVGSYLRIIYEQAGIEIIAAGTAIQHGSIGDTIQIRNTQSGTIVEGTVQPDGSVRIILP